VRPRGRREHRFASVHLFGAVCPERDAGVAPVLPEVAAAARGLFLAEASRAIPTGIHAARVPDRAGWHVSGDLAAPRDLTLVHLPPRSPELNPVERIWLYLRERWLGHRGLAGGPGRGRPRRRLRGLERAPRRAGAPAPADQLPVAALSGHQFMRPV
jgi:DDE superfamily endonuclease